MHHFFYIQPWFASILACVRKRRVEAGTSKSNSGELLITSDKRSICYVEPLLIKTRVKGHLPLVVPFRRPYGLG